jgi:hypothetical protein
MGTAVTGITKENTTTTETYRASVTEFLQLLGIPADRDPKVSVKTGGSSNDEVEITVERFESTD